VSANCTAGLVVCNMLCCCALAENGRTEPGIVLSHNESERFESRFVTVCINDSPSIMLAGMQNSVLGVWVAHGEGMSALSCTILVIIMKTGTFFTRESRMLHASLPSSGRPSPSVTLVSCIKTVQARITKSSPWTAPRSLVYRDKIFVPLGAGVSLERGRRRGVPALKRRHFAVIGSNNVKTVADRYIHAAYHNKHW